MKNIIILLSMGVVGSTIILLNTSMSSKIHTKDVVITTINADAVTKLRHAINSLQTTSNSQSELQEKISINGLDNLKRSWIDVFNYLKESQLLYRYEFEKSFNEVSDELKEISADNYVNLNSKVNDLLDRHLAVVPKLKTTLKRKKILSLKLKKMKNPLTLQRENSFQTSAPTTSNIDFNHLIDNLSQKEALKVDVPVTSTSTSPIAGHLALWCLVMMAIALAYSGKKTVKKNQNDDDFHGQVNSTLKRLLSELDYPLVLCDNNLKIVWQNKISQNFDFDYESIQNILTFHGANPAGTYEIKGINYLIQISALNYKNGKKNSFIQLKPAIVPKRHLEHLVDSTEVEQLLESSSKNYHVFKDFNQTIAELSVRMNYLFKVSGKFLDLDFKPNMADCFIEAHRLEIMAREFILTCHYLAKDREDISGLYLRTDEIGQRFVLGCFIPGFKAQDLETGMMARDFLKRFSILEAKFSICLPTIDLRIVQIGEAKGLDIHLSFENRSELETLINQTVSSV